MAQSIMDALNLTIWGFLFFRDAAAPSSKFIMSCTHYSMMISSISPQSLTSLLTGAAPLDERSNATLAMARSPVQQPVRL